MSQGDGDDCFGEYDEGDSECQECDEAENCKEQSLKPNPISSAASNWSSQCFDGIPSRFRSIFFVSLL